MDDNKKIIVNTNNGPVELTARALELNLEIFEVKEGMRRLFARALRAEGDQLEELVDAIAENFRWLQDLERKLEAENS